LHVAFSLCHYASTILFFTLSLHDALPIFVLLLHKELVLVCFDAEFAAATGLPVRTLDLLLTGLAVVVTVLGLQSVGLVLVVATLDRKSTRLNSSHVEISYAVFCLKKKISI